LSKSLDRIRRATPAQLRRAADVDLWRGGRSGIDARFDADRFGEWLEALVEAGGDVTARQLSALDLDLVVVGIAEHVRVFDGAARTSTANDIEIGGYLVAPRGDRACQQVLDTLASLHDDDPAFFHRVMRACVRLSNDGYERDGLHDVLVDRDQAMFDLLAAREERRERQGFIAAAEARAFLAATAEGRAALFRAHLRATVDHEPPTISDDAVATADGNGDEREADEDIELDDAAPRGLLRGSPDGRPRLERLRTQLDAVREHDAAAFALRLRELAYLANVLVAACTVQGRPLTPTEATTAASSLCNLAIGRVALRGDRVLVDHDLLELFGMGWAVVRDRACFRASRRLIDVLGQIRYHEPETQQALVALRQNLRRHLRDRMPWRAAAGLDVIAILDTPAWAALVGLIADCPIVHAAIPAICERRRTAIDPAAFEFFADDAQFAMVERFLERLPTILTG
jgi:hypothetical protein